MPDPRQATIEYMHIKKRKNEPATALAKKGGTLLGDDPDGKPRGIGAVIAGPAPAQREGGRGRVQGSNGPRRQ